MNTIISYNYKNSVKVILDRWTRAGKEFSAYDVTKELRRLANACGIQFTIHHSNVFKEVSEQIKHYSGYDTKMSPCGAYKVYFAVASTKSTVVNQSLPTRKSKSNNITLNKGKNGKFTVPVELCSKLHRINNRVLIHLNQHGQHISTIDRALDKNNVRFRLPQQTVNVRLSHDNRVLIVEV